jgi:AraC family transcriptional regulator
MMDIKQEETRREYERRIGKAKRHIALHLAEDLALSDIAAEAAFSEFHFHRIFTAFTGETPANHVRRLRLEMAANRLQHDDRSTMAAVGLESGFHNPTVFARAFKERFGITPENFRRGARPTKHAVEPRIEKPFSRSAIGRTAFVPFAPERLLIFSRIGPYDQSLVSFYRKIERQTRHLRNSGNLRLFGITLDNPHITPRNLCRFELGVPVAEGIPAPSNGEIRVFSPGAAAVYPFEGFPFRVEKGFDDLYAYWLPESGFQPAEYPAFLIHHDDHFYSTLPRKTRIDICLPIKPL